MERFILLLLFCISLNAQTITVSGTTYELAGNEIKSDPNTYLHQFIEDALERGYDFTGVRGTFFFIEGTGSTKGYSVRSNACRGSYRIALQRHFWNNYDGGAAYVISGSRNLYEQRRHLVYHELGHALLQLRHVCYEEAIDVNNPLTFFAAHDIMLSSVECPSGYSYSWIHNWERSLDRMFNTEYQITYSCNSNKGRIIDY